MAWHIAKDIERRAAEVQLQLSVEAVEWKPYLSRHAPTEVIVTFSPSDKITAGDLQRLYSCSWKASEKSVVWDSVEHPEEICVNESVDWAQIKMMKIIGGSELDDAEEMEL